MSERRRRIVITGLGVVSPNGIGRDAFADAILAGRSGLSATPDFGEPRSRAAAVGAVLDFDPLAVLDAAEAKRVPRVVALALAASREALAHARWPSDADVEAQRRIGCVLGTGGGGLAFVEDQYRSFFDHGRGSLYSVTGGTHGNLAGELSIACKLRGPSHVISTGCASSTDAIGYAKLLIDAGVVDAVLVGGADAPLSHGILYSFEKMKVLATRPRECPRRASRPFDADRDGFVAGEGAWMFVLESADSARRRGVEPLAELLSATSTCDAFHRVQIAPDAIESARAVSLAIEQAGLTPVDIDYVNLHGTGTLLNDKLETLAMHKALGRDARRIPMSATKSMIGHPQGAGGAAGLAATILSLRRGRIHPTINLESNDADCDLDYTPNVARDTEATVAVCNCIAFGAKNSALCVRVGPRP